MTFRILQLEVAAGQTDAVEAILTGLGASAITLLETGDEAILEPAPGALPLWSKVRMEALFDAADWSRLPQRHIKRLFADLGLQVRIRSLEDRAWEREWMDRFQVQTFGSLTVCPGWLAGSGAREPCILLDPGLAFGTGNHESTRLCLNFLGSRELAGQTVIDYGCGSGILGLAAARLGARRVAAVDLDPQAVQAARENARRNRLQHKLRFPPVATLERCDLLLANIHLAPLVQLAPSLTGLLHPGGTLVLSGILLSQTDALKTVYEPDIHFSATLAEGDWVCLVGERRTRAGREP